MSKKYASYSPDFHFVDSDGTPLRDKLCFPQLRGNQAAQEDAGVLDCAKDLASDGGALSTPLGLLGRSLKGQPNQKWFQSTRMAFPKGSALQGLELEKVFQAPPKGLPSFGAGLEKVGTGLNVLGAVNSAHDGYENSNASSTSGKLAEGAVDGLLNLGIGAISSGPAAVLPLLMGAEHLLTDDPKKQLLSGFVNSYGSTVSSTIDALQGDPSTLQETVQDRLDGDEGGFVKMLTEGGQFWSEHGPIEGLDTIVDSIDQLIDLYTQPTPKPKGAP